MKAFAIIIYMLSIVILSGCSAKKSKASGVFISTKCDTVCSKTECTKVCTQVEGTLK